MAITIYHNPSCGTSRNTLEMIRRSGEDPVIIEYLKNTPTKKDLKELLKMMGAKPRDILRDKAAPYEELGLADTKWSDDALLDFMIENPILINRPIVKTPLGVRLCRPSEKVLEILPNAIIGDFTKEDGEVVLPKAKK